MGISPLGCRCHLGHLPRLRTTLLGEAQVGAGQSVDARLCTLILIRVRFPRDESSRLRWLIGHFRTLSYGRPALHKPSLSLSAASRPERIPTTIPRAPRQGWKPERSGSVSDD